MSVVVLRSLDALRAYRREWDCIFQRDPLASIQRSWLWQYSWASATPGWAVAISLDGDGGAVLPFQILQRHDGVRELRLGGSRLAAIGGLLCTAGDDATLACLARYLRHDLEWDCARWDDVGDPRVSLLAPRLSGWADEVRLVPSNELSVIELPSTWDEYLAGLSPATRANLRKRIRQAGRAGLRVSSAGLDTIDGDTEELLQLWQRRWGAKPQRLLDEICMLYRLAAEDGVLRMRLWRQDARLVAGLAGFTDPRGTFHCFMSAHHDCYDGLSLSKVAMAEAIRWSIANGYRQFSFGRGPERYKRSLNALPKPLLRMVLNRASLRTALYLRLTRGLSG